MICNTLAAMWRVGAFQTLDRVLALKEKNQASNPFYFSWIVQTFRSGSGIT
jgi:hypothetical protein